MNLTYGARDIVRNPSLLKIDSRGSFIVEDKREHKKLGIYLGIDLANEFLAYKKRQDMLRSARKIRQNSKKENDLLDGTVDDGL